jgi:methylmalonyl-CoA/ethylmalonyl-CoA epimerase
MTDAGSAMTPDGTPRRPAIRGLDHIGIAVDDAEGVARILCAALGADPRGQEELPAEALRVVSIDAGPVHLELFEPTRPDTAVRRFIDRRGNGLHHVCLEVDDLGAALDRLRDLDVRLIDETPRQGAYGSRVAFIHPRATGGILFELSERPAGDACPPPDDRRDS